MRTPYYASFRVYPRLTLNRSVLPLLAVALGVVNAFLLFGPGPIDPTNIDWIFGDNATYYFGWATYRHDPHLHLPLAWTERIGYPLGASIAWLDAIPLVAIVLRPLGPILPEPFQYLGLYSMACCVLQAYFGLRLSTRLFPAQPAFAVLAGLFFLLSAPFTWRAFGHTALLSHWLILAGLDSYFRDTSSGTVRYLRPQWVIVAVAAGITPYVAAICLFVALTAVGRLLLERRCRWPHAAMLCAATAGVMVGAAAVIGVLASGDATSYRAPGYGLISLNLNSLVNPMQYGSILLPALPVINPLQVEGYNYLGLGVLGLLAVNVLRRPLAVRWLADRRLLPLVALSIVATLLALSTTVSLNSRTLVQIPLPDQALALLHGLRASGRLFWPVYYLIVLGTLSWTFYAWRAPYNVAILVVALAIQIADMMPLRTKIRETTNQRFGTALQSPEWNELGDTHDNLILVPPYQCAPNTGPGGVYSYVTFGKLIAAERMRSNSYYAARYSGTEFQAHCVDLLRTQLEGRLDPDSAYIVTDGVRTVWSLGGMRSHSCRVVDGFNLCTPSTSTNAGQLMAPPPAAPYAVGDAIDFRSNGNAQQYLTFGWGAPSSDGTWTEGPMAVLRLGLDAGMDRSRALVLEAAIGGFAGPRTRRLDVDVVVNGQTADHWVIRSAAELRRQIRVPASVVAARGELDVEFRVRNPAAPLSAGQGPANTFLGPKVREIVIRYE
jgi:hypothetical protein